MNPDIHNQPPHDKIFAEFLARQRQEGMALAAESDILNLRPMNGPASDRYIAEFVCRGLVQDEAGEVVEFNRFAVWASGFRRTICGVWICR